MAENETPDLPRDPVASADLFKMSAEQHQRAVSWFNEKLGADLPPCRFCKNPLWTMADHLVATPVTNGTGVFAVGPTYPHVMFICTNCGSVELFNAIVAGVVERIKT